MRNFLSWLPWLGLVVVGAVVGGTLGLTGVFGHPTTTRTVLTSDVSVARTAPAYSCPGGPRVTSLQAHDRVLATQRSDDSSYLAVREPLNLARTVWVSARDVAVDSNQAAIASLPYVRVGGWPIIDDPGTDTITVSISTVEGIPCGSAVIYRHELAVFPDGGADACDMQNSGSRVSPIYHYITNYGFSGDLRVDVTVKYLDGHVGTSSQVINASEDAPTVCNPRDPGDICGHIQDVFEVDIPYYPLPNHPDPNDGVMDVVVGWDSFGDSGQSSWQIHTDDLQMAPTSADPSTAGALLNTDHRVTASVGGGPEVVSADFDLQSNTPADYTMHLVGVSGSGCMSGVTSLTAHGHVANEATVTIPGLCYGAQYFASVTLTNSHGTTTWGHDSPEAGWLGYFFSTPNRSVTITATETVETAGKVQFLDATLGGQELNPLRDPAVCWTGVTHVGGATLTLRLPTSTTLHLEYRMPPAGSDCSTYQHEVLYPLTEVDIPINLDSLASSGSGQIFSQGPFSVKLQIVPSS